MGEGGRREGCEGDQQRLGAGRGGQGRGGCTVTEEGPVCAMTEALGSVGARSLGSGSLELGRARPRPCRPVGTFLLGRSYGSSSRAVPPTGHAQAPGVLGAKGG